MNGDCGDLSGNWSVESSIGAGDLVGTVGWDLTEVGDWVEQGEGVGDA